MGPTLVLTAHGSADPRSAATTRAVAEQIGLLRPDLRVRVAFCEKSTPNLRDVLAGLDGPAIVTPLLLASAYHARVDIPALIAAAGAQFPVSQAETLGEHPRLVRVLHQRVTECVGDSEHDRTGVLVVAVGSSDTEANTRTGGVADTLGRDHHWAAVGLAFATGPAPSVSEGLDRLRDLGARRLVVAPWFVAPGRITDRLTATVHASGAEMAGPLGAHPLVAETLLDRFDAARRGRAAA